ncbi:hypothetical protein GGTG_08624 [Gaeumannomyces tritici R3-111a-1]|uniref:FAD-binding PCMH-type domain-containing protein n=1 Tax=Gaeumannomyces tritici (strain R3-111a-1) TaxID=644352 RepID=J3P538_GAET3|nr:hypothetical protein GGTG_08624 [Gaeumannomyces tritici R3-111a-1]EJT74786.1 hypothetical protein GGTG_08624 [Gaeumannomyces tritici R3-111a-1]
MGAMTSTCLPETVGSQAAVGARALQAMDGMLYLPGELWVFHVVPQISSQCAQHAPAGRHRRPATGIVQVRQVADDAKDARRHCPLRPGRRPVPHRARRRRRRRDCKARPARGCSALKAALPDSVFFPRDAVYAAEAAAFWSNTQLMNPGCSVRGGGHMGIRGANNIDGGGMLIVMPGLATLELSPNGKRVDLGPALKWGAVYKYLAQHNLTAPGGRLSPVGVPGLLLGGGVSFIGNQVGWAADNVVEYEVVLASGDVVKVNKDASPDLFWALKGSSANFGIVTKFTVNTFPFTTVYAGTYTVSAAHGPAFLDAIANYTSGAIDPLSHMVPMAVPAAPGVTVYSAILFYDSPTESAPECFREFLALPAVSTTMGFKTVADFTVETGKLVVDKINDVFIAGTTVGHDYESQRRGIEITNRPIGAVWQEASERQNPAGFQDGYTGYGAANKQKLLDVSRKYDSERVFQKLWPGGFKIGA